MRRVFVSVVVLTLLVVGAPASEAHEYVGGGTTVVKGASSTLLDEGAVVCNGETGEGGACIPFSDGGSSIHVVDDTLGEDVAFQVCIDNDGNRACGGDPFIGGCADTIVFSHDDDGSFANPLAVSTGFTPGCPGGYPGWVVFICDGVHDAGGAHTHVPTHGTIETSTDPGEAGGDFCGGPPLDLGKPYFVPGSLSVFFTGGMSVGAFLPGSPSGLCFAGFAPTAAGGCAVGGGLLQASQRWELQAPAGPATECRMVSVSEDGTPLATPCNLDVSGTIGAVAGVVGPSCNASSGTSSTAEPDTLTGLPMTMEWRASSGSQVPVEGVLTGPEGGRPYRGHLEVRPIAPENCATDSAEVFSVVGALQATPA